MAPTYFAPKAFLETAYALLEELEQEAPRETTEEDFEAMRSERIETYAEALTDIASADTTYIDASHYAAAEFDWIEERIAQ